MKQVSELVLVLALAMSIYAQDVPVNFVSTTITLTPSATLTNQVQVMSLRPSAILYQTNGAWTVIACGLDSNGACVRSAIATVSLDEISAANGGAAVDSLTVATLRNSVTAVAFQKIVTIMQTTSNVLIQASE